MKDKHVIVTGGANGIGRCITLAFLKTGANVSVIDIDQTAGEALVKEAEIVLDDPSSPRGRLSFFRGDIADKAALDQFLKTLNHPVDFLINNACLSRKGLLSNCGWEDFEYVQRVGVTAPYYLIHTLVQQKRLSSGASIVNIASTRGVQSQADTESYSAAKGGILALTHAMSVSLAGHARVNVISPGWIDTQYADHSQEDKSQHPAGRIGVPEDIANMVLFLCDETKSGFITGENIVIDGGMSKLMIYHNDGGWKYKS